MSAHASRPTAGMCNGSTGTTQCRGRRVTVARGVEDRPSLIIARTHIGYGSPHKQDTWHAHGEPLGDEEVRLTKRALGWPEERTFYVPDEALRQFRECVERGAELEAGWRQRV